MKAHRYAHSTPVAGVSLPLWPAVKEEWEFHFVHVHVCVHVHVHACTLYNNVSTVGCGRPT